MIQDRIVWSIRVGWILFILVPIRCAASADSSVVQAVVDQSSFPIPKITQKRKDVEPFQYVDAKIAYYPPGGSRRGDGTWNKMQLPLEPKESQKHMVTPVGFEANLFAAEPEIIKPICMDWDERGRLWIAESIDYPNNKQPDGQGHDRIKICEDTDGDGRADRFTVFADKLSIPTSLTFSHGGVIVHQPPKTLFLKDTNGDDRADVRKVLFEGWSTGDTHAGPSNLQYGLDNWIWGMQGYAGFDGVIGGERRRFGMGFYRFNSPLRPPLSKGETRRGLELEFLRSTNNNTWGIGFSEDGLAFGSTANRNPSVYLPIPNRYYEAVRGWSASQLGGIADTHLFKPITDRIRQVDHHGGYTAAAGHALYTARTYPREYWNRTAFVCGPTGNLVGVFLLKGDGADFRSTNPFNMLASDDEWTAPIMAEVGPDGHVWIIDWYNYIVQHNPTPAGYKTGKGNAYETGLRDKKHGRIYRVVYKAAKPFPAMSLASATPEQLVASLKHDNLFWRKHAQRLVVERGRLDVLPALIELADDPCVDEIGLNTAVIHALWTMHGLGALNESYPKATAVAVAALKHNSAGVRRNAVAVVPRNTKSLRAILESGLLNDPDAQVRLAALLALSEMPTSAEAGRAIAGLLSKPENFNDGWIPDAATSAAAAHDVHFLKAIAAGKTPPRKLLDVLGIVAEHYARGGPAVSVGSLILALPDAETRIAETIIGGLAKGWPPDCPVALHGDVEQAMVALLPQLSAGAQGRLVKLATAWGSSRFEQYAAGIVQSLLATVRDEKNSDHGRLAAAHQLVGFRASDDTVVTQVLDCVSPRASPGLASGLIDALGASESTAVGSAIVERLGRLTPSARTAALRVLLRRPESTRALLDGIEAGKVPLSDLALEQKQALTAHPSRWIARRARKLLAHGGGLPDPDRQMVLEVLMPLTKRTGDPAAGKLVFQKQCANCHTHGGDGNRIGPDLTGMAVHSKAQLLTEIIDPSRSLEGNYRVYTVVTEDGRVLTGLLASETKTTIELFDTEGKKQVLLREDIEDLVTSPKSLMPDGFEKQVQNEDIVHLLEFLTQRGKFLPIPLDKAATMVSTRGMFYDGSSTAERLIFRDWSPKAFQGIPFHLIDPQGDRVPNVILLYSPQGKFPPRMPKSVTLPCNAPARAIHFLSGVGGWGYPLGQKGSVSMIVRLHYADGQMEDHPLRNGEHFADYIRRVDVPGSKLAFMLRNQQIRYLAVYPHRRETIKEVELVKGPDRTAPVLMAVTVEIR